MGYKIWNQKDDIFTPSGEKFTAIEWASRYSWITIPGTKMVIADGIKNGAFCEEYETFKTYYKNIGVNITDDMTEEEVFAAVEEFEKNPPGANEPTNEERIAAALEAQVMMAEPETEVAAYSTYSVTEENVTSPAFNRVKSNYIRGLWSKNILMIAMSKGIISEEEAQSILNGE